MNNVRRPNNVNRRGSTLVIVIALLGLLLFTGMVFFTFANQEHVASQYFSDAAKAQVPDKTHVWPHMLEHVLVGPPERYRGSILYSPTRRHSMVRNLVGGDIYPQNSSGVSVPATLPPPSANDAADANLFDFVDSPAARFGTVARALPSGYGPDVDYTYPDINNLFLAYRGWAVRDNGSSASPQYTQVPVIIPSFFRPAYMQAAANSSDATRYSLGPVKSVGSGSTPVLTNPHWAYAYDPPAAPGDPVVPATPDISNQDTVLFRQRSFRPHPSHLAGRTPDGNPVRRYLTDEEAGTPGINLAAGGFPFLPEDANGNGLAGDLGIWTATYDPSKTIPAERFDASMYELDSDNDLDGIKEGIWMDLHFPVQDFTDGSGSVRQYVILHSVTIYDLDGLINLNVHGNYAGLEKLTSSGAPQTLPMAAANEMTRSYLSRSHQGLGPNEVNPLVALRRGDRGFDSNTEEHMFLHYGGVPSDTLQQANAEWIWLLMGRGDYENYTVTRDASGAITGIAGQELKDLFGGRLGDKNLLYNSLEQTTPRLRIVDLPRPGASGKVYETVTGGISFGGRAGLDDNNNRFEGEAVLNGAEVMLRPFGHPMSFSGRGKRTRVDYPEFDTSTGQFIFAPTASTDQFAADNPLLPLFLRDTASQRPDQWPGYIQYGAASSMSSTTPVRYSFGVNETYNGDNAELLTSGGSDDLNHSPAFDELFEDMLETIFDQDKADRVRDGIASVGDLIALQWADDDTAAIKLANAQDSLSEHMSKLAPHALALDSPNREMFTTYSNALRYIAKRWSPERSWEYSADSDGDGLQEFPPQFGSVAPFAMADPAAATPVPGDPFRPELRRLLANERGENRNMIGALPISINHVLDVDRTRTPPSVKDGAVYLRYMKEVGFNFRPLTEHPHVSQTDPDDTDAIAETEVPTLELISDSDPNTVASEVDVPFPPRNFSQQEFWARRDRQKLARDIYVLLYTLGGAQQSGGAILDYTAPNAPVGTTYSHAELRRMAQFAVNMVDAMDRDNVITKFEYDKNLGDGWDLDDDPYTAESSGAAVGTFYDAQTGHGMYREDNDTRGVVYGVESQQLAFSEVLGVHSDDRLPGAPAATIYQNERDHLFVELQNVTPNTVDLATTESTDEDTAIWRLGRYDRTAADSEIGDVSQPDRTLVLQRNAGSIPGGEYFTIAGASTDEVISSDFFVDYDLDGTYDVIAPDVSSAAAPTTATSATDPTAAELKPRCDLDLIHSDHGTDRFLILNATGTVDATPGYFLDTLQPYAGNQLYNDWAQKVGAAGFGDYGVEPEDGFDLVLQRRLNPNMPSLANTSGQASSIDINPWVEVDRVRVTFKDFNLGPADNATTIPGKLETLLSEEREEPLNDLSRRVFFSPPPGTSPDNRFNTIGNDFNSSNLQDPTMPFDATTNPVEEHELWQPHFNRDFASAGELLNLPIYGPNLVTQRLDHSRRAPYQQLQDQLPTSDPIPPATSATDNLSWYMASGAAAILLRPDLNPADAADSVNDNRWYRLFQFVEVPSRVNRMLGNYLTQNRVPGKINLNMIRHLEVYAGLLDDPMFADVDGDRLNSPFLTGSTPGAVGRDRWRQFLTERDGDFKVDIGYYDPTPADSTNGDEVTTFIVPGTVEASPFRSLDHRNAAANDNGLEDTILRMIDEDDGSLTANRNWLEVGSPASHTTPAPSTSTAERHQLLSKILNNTTNVSNTFVIFATAGYFEAYEDPTTGFVRVGGRVNIDPAGGTTNPGWEKRAVFVIDRTEAYSAFDRGTSDFDWERLVKYQAIIE